GLDRRESQAHLVEQRQQKGDSADPQSGEQITGDRNPKTANPHQSQPQQGMLRAQRVQAVRCEQRGGDGEQSQYLAPAQAGFAENFQHIRQQGNAGSEQYQADDVERMIALLAVVGQMSVDHVQTAQA